MWTKSGKFQSSGRMAAVNSSTGLPDHVDDDEHAPRPTRRPAARGPAACGSAPAARGRARRPPCAGAPWRARRPARTRPRRADRPRRPPPRARSRRSPSRPRARRRRGRRPARCRRPGCRHRRSPTAAFMTGLSRKTASSSEGRAADHAPASIAQKPTSAPMKAKAASRWSARIQSSVLMRGGRSARYADASPGILPDGGAAQQDPGARGATGTPRILSPPEGWQSGRMRRS